MDKYYEAISLFRRRNFEKCVEVCNTLLQIGQESRAEVFGTEDDDSAGHVAAGGDGQTTGDCKSCPAWVMEGIWQLKMRALTQRVYVDDLEANDDSVENEDIEFARIATAARPGTSIKTAFNPRPSSSLVSARPRTGTARSRPVTGMARPGTTTNRPGSALNGRPSTRCGTARQVRVTSAAAFTMGDPTSSLFQASRLNPTIYAERKTVIKSLFQFLFYHEGDPQKAYALCEAVADAQKQKLDWWWEQQRARCLITLNQPRKAEELLKKSVATFPHPYTYLLMCKMYLKLNEPQAALQLLDAAIERNPHDVCLRTQQARIFEQVEKAFDSVAVYRKIAQMDPINAEALACIAVSYFYDNQPEMALVYYRRILSLGAHSAELYCNIALCCLYGGQIDLVLPCFQRALKIASTPDQRADIWYNLSFVALTTGDFNLAKRCLRLCLTSDASNGAALNNLAILAVYAGDIPKAKSYLTAAKSALSDSPEIEANLKYMEKNHKV